MWKVVGAKAIGTTHARNNEECQDFIKVMNLADDVWVLALSDGAGAARCGLDGARTSVKAAIGALSMTWDGGKQVAGESQLLHMLDSALHAVRLAIMDKAGQEHPPTELPDSDSDGNLPVVTSLNDYATTLLLCIITPTHVAALQLGDGAIVVVDGDMNPRLLTFVPLERYLNETRFVTDDDFAEHRVCAVVPTAGVHGVALLSDGLEMLAIQRLQRQPHAPFFKPLFAFVESPEASGDELERFLESERVCAVTDDDKAVIVACKV